MLVFAIPVAILRDGLVSVFNPATTVVANAQTLREPTGMILVAEAGFPQRAIIHHYSH
jgi:hypothetical protein